MRYQRIGGKICKVDAFGKVSNVYTAVGEMNELIETLNKQHDELCAVKYKLMLSEAETKSYSGQYKIKASIANYINEKNIKQDIESFKRVHDFLTELLD